MFQFESRTAALATGVQMSISELISKFNSYYIPTLTDSSKVNRTTNYYLEYWYKQLKQVWTALTAAQQSAINQKLWSFQKRLRAVESGAPDPHVLNTSEMITFDSAGNAVPVPSGGLPVPGIGTGGAAGVLANTLDELKKPVTVAGGYQVPLWVIYGGLGLGAALLLRESGKVMK